MPKRLKQTIDRIRLLFCKEKRSYSALYNILGFVPKSIEPYRTAFTHSSLTTTTARKRSSCNERLEFLGDAVLSSVISDYLYCKFHHEREGFLSKSRSRLVCRERLNNIAVEIGIDKFVNTHGIEQKHNNYIYGNAFEAFIGAIYIDRGYDYCRTFILERILPRLGDVESVIKADKNYKSQLIEWGQKRHKDVSFELLGEERRTEGVYFRSCVSIDGEPYGEGEGFSKRESQQVASYNALCRINSTDTQESENEVIVSPA